MTRDDAKVLFHAGLIALFVICFAAIAHAEEPKLPNGISCEDVRAKVAELGRVKALALAFENGATWKQIRQAMRCLK